MASEELKIGTKVSFRPNWKVPATTGKIVGVDGQFYVVKSDDGKERRIRKGGCTRA